MKNLHDYIAESEEWATTPMPGDEFDIELAPDHLIESYVIETLEDGIVIQADEQTMSLLEQYGCTTEAIRRYGPSGSNRGVGFSVAEGIDGSNDFYAFADLFSHPNEYTHPDPEEAVRLITAQGQNPKITASNIIKFAKSNPDELSNSAVSNAVKSLMSQGVAEGSRNAYLKHNNLVDIEKPLAGLKSAFEKFLQTHDPEEKQKYQQGIKQRIKSEPMSGPKGQLPEQSLDEVQFGPDMFANDPERLEYIKKQGDISKRTGLAVGDTVTLKDRPGFKGKIVHDWGGGNFTISGSGGGMSQSNNHRANARLIQKIQGVAEGLHPMIIDDVKKLATLNPADRYSAYSNIRGYFKADPELSKMASDLMGGYYEADMLRGKYKTDAAKAKYAELEPMHQAFIKRVLGQEQGLAEEQKTFKRMMELAGVADHKFNQQDDVYNEDQDAAVVAQKELDTAIDNPMPGVHEEVERETSPVARAILHRILMQHPSMLQKHGPERVMSAVEDVADFVGDVEEIGTSDVSGWIRQVEQNLNRMVNEATDSGINFQGRMVDRASLEIDDVYSWDYPDFSDAYISYATYTDGTPLSDDELEQFNDQHSDLVHELAFDSLHESEIGEAKYRGREVPLGKPMAGDVKKSKVYVRDPATGNIKKVNFGHGGTSAKRAGQKTMKIKKSNPARRKSFRARHNCDNPGPRTKARYWSCRAW